ncbi:polyphosphate kinase 2 [Flavobacterium croceum]|uniref:ADP/GDP-polyphosphate phosphotransferase n=1 Tax=Flavobacterium croceum DSM 17960 TaxID=1121886 RepID=A0A2S4N8T2_9FLAO|nr:polyphosphate kinase 2 [Flavobacterium croceum]POS02101.1 polyphosphate kinase 2 [Flavobacterium croceum DSM 17960]
MTLTDKELKLINSKDGLMALLNQEELDVEKATRLVKYENRLAKLHEELIKLQSWVVNNKKKVVILFEGRDAAGKGGAIRRIVEHLNPREHRVVALPKPNEIEAGQWYFQRYINHLPKEGELVFFDRSWYNRAVVEPVNGFCTQDEYEMFMNQVNEVEKMIIQSGVILLKLYFSISKEEQAYRFKDIQESPLKKWKYSPVDQKALELWDEYTAYKEKMFEKTSTDYAPWQIIKANRKTKARIEALEYILQNIPYTVKNDEIIVHQEIVEDEN